MCKQKTEIDTLLLSLLQRTAIYYLSISIELPSTPPTRALTHAIRPPWSRAGPIASVNSRLGPPFVWNHVLQATKI